MRTLLQLFLLVVTLTGIHGQGAGTSTIGLEVEAGSNFAITRSPIIEQIETDKLSLQPGYQVGLNLALWPSSPSSLLFTTALMQERGILNNYRRERDESDPLFDPAANNLQTINGDVTIKETWFRIGLEGHFHLHKFLFILGAQVSAAYSGSLDYSFTKTTTGLFEPITDRVFIFDEPTVSSGTRDLYEDNSPPGHAGVILGFGFDPMDKLSLRLRYDLGVRAGPVSKEFRMRRARFGVTASYLFWANER